MDRCPGVWVFGIRVAVTVGVGVGVGVMVVVVFLGIGGLGVGRSRGVEGIFGAGAGWVPEPRGEVAVYLG